VAGYPYDELNNTSVCTDTNASDLIVVSRGYWVITDSHGIGTTQPVITAVAPPYAFNVSMTWGATAHPGGQLQMGASSVCLWPHGPPSPGQ
jgi:hypothetical protein